MRPRRIDCREAMARLYEYLDGELTEVRAAEVRDHLDECAPCLTLSRFETAYLRFLEARARARGAPPHMKRRILQELFLSDGEADPA